MRSKFYGPRSPCRAARLIVAFGQGWIDFGQGPGDGIVTIDQAIEALVHRMRPGGASSARTAFVQADSALERPVRAATEAAFQERPLGADAY
jgi:hypothetical protein